MGQQKELMKQLITSRSKDGKETKGTANEEQIEESQIYSDIKIRCDGQLVGLDNNYTAFGKENIDLEEWLSDLQKKVAPVN